MNSLTKARFVWSRWLHGLLATLLLVNTVELSADQVPADQVQLWHTFAVNSENEKIIERSVDTFEAANPDIVVKVTRIPYSQNLPQFINSSQGGEAPDIIRVSDSELGKIGYISVEGLPLLEDLRPHLTPVQRSRFEARALTAMRYGDPLYAIPVSQGCLALVYNKALFDAAGIEYPRDDWTTDDMIRAAEALTSGDVKGLSVPQGWSYFFLPFMTAFGGELFDDENNPTLNSPGTVDAMNWFLDLYRERDIMLPGIDIEGMSTQFMLGRAAMILDGPWSLVNYEKAGIDLGVSVMPTLSESGQRMQPMFSYFGWAVSKQSKAKIAAVKLALWLSGDDVQKDFAIASYTMPISKAAWNTPEITSDAILQTYHRQSAWGMQPPTIRATSMVFEQLDTAMEMTYKGEMEAREALEEANAMLNRILNR